MCDADIAARCFFAELILQKGEIRAFLFGRRDFGKAVIAVDADGVITESGAGEGSHAAARYGDEFARRRFTGKRLAGGLAGGYRAGTDALAVLIYGQCLRRFIDDDAVRGIRIDRAQLFGADIAADKGTVFIAVGFDERPSVVALENDVQALA